MSNKAYDEYLQSETWRTIRAQRLAVDDGECVLCGEEAKHVHHRRYPKELGTETVKDLVCLCDGCHTKHHNGENWVIPEWFNQKQLENLEVSVFLRRYVDCFCRVTIFGVAALEILVHSSELMKHLFFLNESRHNDHLFKSHVDEFAKTDQ